MVAALSPSRSSFGSGYSLHSGAGDEPPGAAEAAAGEAGGGGQLPRGVASGRLSAAAGGSGGGFSNVTDEELAAMDPKRAKRLIANRQARLPSQPCLCSFTTLVSPQRGLSLTLHAMGQPEAYACRVFRCMLRRGTLADGGVEMTDSCLPWGSCRARSGQRRAS